MLYSNNGVTVLHIIIKPRITQKAIGVLLVVIVHRATLSGHHYKKNDYLVLSILIDLLVLLDCLLGN